MTDVPGTGEADQSNARASRFLYGMAAVKVVFILALLRMFAGPMTKDFFDEELISMPTWEWALCSLTPGIMVFLARRPQNWARLADERNFLRIPLSFYLLYGLAFAVFQGMWILWIAVAASLGAFVGIRYLNGKEAAHAH
ncbi:hypothetical protein ACKI1I_35115 [Streptomyces turgidiscabies]|uniref:Uncharacterized protein n=1 Tax=Streptomyces turgidiscabies (strain Car8) TaxID=698760 RepID=L7F106_STRT8|nr:MULTISPECIES: hypothetical protein [Streptomyces]ELP64270.1 hypothetical protein STRTUCAR8_04615 [Streptomyces turgidiscabies Car8]MDX3495709.1 hypothetical protein [Streptomyces turgidiscabies]GAQ75517.1 hypothetical protein T45_07302 [Streptomyces turgidiscabies]